ncbi:protein TolR [Luteibacter anthropi]|uniref:Tol-Pal system protein TolR n=1 Tax=Luteibacter anthropi TaxID=564369 RepID=A0A7X5ZI80_9GAMM|nr:MULTISPECIES: protein TolR [Luteibacter]KAF1004883.1 MAG: Protein TolR [Luteibacter sp.]NII06410.1 protein TolR [Luteibacter anthropi]URX60624.1 protein TolR [Luteibacter anthropi]
MRTSYRRQKRKLKSEINVVPYIDVMLVLLIIFMVTTPMMNLGVDIQLPQTNAKSLQDKKDPIVVSVDENGQIYLTANGTKREPVSEDEFRKKVTAFHDANPELQVLVAGDQRVGYGKVYSILPILQEAGVSKIGLMSQPQSAQNGKP